MVCDAEFVVPLHRHPHRWLRLPHIFAGDIEGRRHAGVWLRAYGCGNGPISVVVDFSPSSAMFLKRWWKSFARSHGLDSEHLLHFRFDEGTMLSVRFFRNFGSRLGCCAKISNDSGLDTSSNSDDDDSSPNAKLEEDDSE
ncbi:l-ascorbate oxidase-like protein [Hordeum vulgare]|nr:l-ascorbate oxidase-like protein [Hordeum vulgare]